MKKIIIILFCTILGVYCYNCMVSNEDSSIKSQIVHVMKKNIDNLKKQY